ncbi:hypothetical protein NP7_11865 (plasmid) [Moraxella osloensis]|uniref:Uncharacterized protein n=1 Tax=Faucicola osloensis TaxID=34062 RepID=A0A2D2LYG0_FAUOS|nr:hypothetical protein NP7_11865 [Moraxella osloensis]
MPAIFADIHDNFLLLVELVTHWQQVTGYHKKAKHYHLSYQKVPVVCLNDYCDKGKYWLTA